MFLTFLVPVAIQLIRESSKLYVTSTPPNASLPQLNDVAYHKSHVSWLCHKSINQSRCHTRVTSGGDPINEPLICRPVLCHPD